MSTKLEMLEKISNLADLMVEAAMLVGESSELSKGHEKKVTELHKYMKSFDTAVYKLANSLAKKPK